MIREKCKAKPELVFWFDAPPRAGSGVFRYVAQAWGSKVYYMCVDSLSKERRIGGWEDCDHGDAVVTILGEKPDPTHFVKKFVYEHPHAIHVCNGFRSHTERFFKNILFHIRDARIAMWSERPGVYGSPMKKIIKKLGIPVLYRYYALRYNTKIQVFLPLGTIGVKTFARFGWSPSILFPFMYDPQIIEGLPKSSPRVPREPLRLLYVGRFGRSTKGVDVLIHATDRLVGGNWHLDMVGGYGDLKDFTIAWAAKHPNVSFLGTWPSNEICQRITHYDLCIVPSRFDGWNVVVNEAIHAGVGVIASDEAVSSELVKASGAGVVVSAGDVGALRKAIQHVIDAPALADSWKEKARAYSPRIASESVGRYFMDILEYTFLEPSRPRPECPWL
jgi:glycosyltransferase involved in cell wall biosynthesis